MNGKQCSAVAIAAFLAVLAFSVSAGAHCQIPCGIYDDGMRFGMISEHIATIEKSMKQIHELEKAQPVNYNQLVRWIMNKEKHAAEIQEIVGSYFLAQRIKAGTDHYAEKLTVLHAIIVSAMKCKQTTDLAHTEALRKHLKAFHDLYFGHSH